MRLDTSFRFEQQMRLAPRIIQAMEILQLPVMALQERIDAEMQSNPVLELASDSEDDQAPAELAEESPERGEQAMVVREGGDHGEDFQRLSDFEDEFEPWMSDTSSGRTVAGERDRKLDAMANAPAQDQSLHDYLQGQWTFVEATAELKQAGQAIISYIDDDGYLHTTLDEIHALTEKAFSPEILRHALAMVQTLEPPGVAARDLRECLLLQLAAEAAAGGEVTLETELVKFYLRDIEMNRLPQIVRRTGKTIEQIKTAIRNLARFNPRPGSLVSRRSAPVVMPDIIVEIDDAGQVIVTMSDGNTPPLHISQSYKKMSKDRSVDRDARQFIRRSIRSAQWLVGAIQQRRQTVCRVAQEVFKAQREFLDHGPEALKPLPMAEVAEKVRVHVATISRAVAGKYVQTPQGIFPLRMFFSGGKTNDKGQDVAWDAIRVKLKEVVDGEDKSKPLSDDQIVEAIKGQGIEIARRTVAKYRNLLEIPPARKRKKF